MEDFLLRVQRDPHPEAEGTGRAASGKLEKLVDVLGNPMHSSDHIFWTFHKGRRSKQIGALRLPAFRTHTLPDPKVNKHAAIHLQRAPDLFQTKRAKSAV